MKEKKENKMRKESRYPDFTESEAAHFCAEPPKKIKENNKIDLRARDDKMIDDLNVLLAQTAEMEKQELKKLVNDRKMGFSGSVAYGKAKACDLFIRGLTEILYETKKEEK